jgi:hypothetical protein
MSNVKSDLLYDVDYDRIKSVEVCFEYAFETELVPSYESQEESIKPATEDQGYGSIVINDPILATMIVRFANDNTYVYLNMLVDQYLKSKGLSLKSFFESYEYAEDVDEGVFEMIEDLYN